MGEYCILCGRYVETSIYDRVHTLKHSSTGDIDFVCEECVNSKLNTGEPVRGCLYCNGEPDYRLQEHSVRRKGRYSILPRKERTVLRPRGEEKPIVCEEDFQRLIEDDQDHTLSIEKVLSDKDQLEAPSISVPEVIGQEEDQHIEYKETFQYATYEDEQDVALKANTVKEVAAFGNTNGGVVIIGVHDDSKEIRGLERDYDSMGGGRDKFELQVIDVIRSRIGHTFASQYVDIEFHEIEDKDICAIHVKPNPNALTVNDEFYIRQGSSSQSLSSEDTIKYLSDRWNT